MFRNCPIRRIFHAPTNVNRASGTTVEIGARLQDGEIRLKLGPVAADDRVLHADDCVGSDCGGEQAGQLVDAAGMPAADRRHPDDFPIQQLEPVVLTEDARLGHPVEFVHAERPPEQLRVHGVLIIARVGVEPPGDRRAPMPRTCRR